MRRTVLLSVVGLAGFGGATALAAGGAAPPRAVVEGMVCTRAPNPLARAVGITAVMRPVAGTERMELRFQLLRRAEGASEFTAVQGGDLGRWRHPTDPPGLGQRPEDVWRLTKEVVNLTGPAVYRFRVTFRWRGASGRELGRVMRLSGTCAEPG